MILIFMNALNAIYKFRSDEDFGAGLAPMDSNSKKFLSTSQLFEDENSFKEYISKIPNK